MMKIFFSNALNDYVTDEICTCGHLKSEHGSKLTKISSKKTLRDSHDGNCCCGQCRCSGFKFKRYLTITESAEIKLSKRLLAI